MTNVKASNGYAYGSASILRYAGNGQEQEQQKISECLLSELTVNNGTLSPDFDKYVDNYWINIEDKDSITITAKAKEDGDKVSVKKDGKEIDMKDVKIEKGMETVDVIVSTEGNAKTYSLFISRNIPEEQEKPDEPVVDVPDEPEEPETPENPDKPTEEEPSTEKPKRELPFNPVVAIIIVVIAGGLIALIVIFQLKQSKKEYDESDEAYRIREEKERQKRVEQMRRERQGDQYVETKKGLFKKNK